ncbi:rgs-5 [Pristionchus pacificus]|uniref:Rgs-5 n=1 Tax=Pristionchus pacificus TaxID=54126 RepID=A0A2A6BWC6_PRIPA|nr:rgs-5 [Pristionchus pacificus]|eukprot:PDM70136.1 rgs-5 [Pristionchus pacificus]
MNKAVSFINRIKKSSNGNSNIRSVNDFVKDSDESQVVLNNSVHSRHVRLAHSLNCLLLDPSAISYFIHFFEDSGKVNLINFWIHVRSFKDSTSIKNVPMTGLLLSDARRIYEKYVDEQSRHNIGLPKRMALSMKENIDKEAVDDGIFNEAQDFVYHLFKLRYFDEFKQSIHYKRHELDVLQNTTFDLEDLMYSQELLPVVMEVVNDDFDRNRIQFIIAVHTFEDSSDGTDEEMESDAMAIYERYISLQARMPIQISDSARTQIESLICTHDGKPSKHCFDLAKKGTLAVLSRKYRDTINESTSFIDYIKDLHSTIENTIELPSIHNRRGRDDSHSGTSSSNGTTVSLLRSNEYLERRWSTSSTSTAVNSIVNSPRTSRLAEVDELGRYRPLYDNSLVSIRKEGKLKEKLRKYVDKNGLREEEMADEVARSIIADVIASTNIKKH